MKSMNIFHLSPETVKLCLQEIESVSLLCNKKKLLLNYLIIKYIVIIECGKIIVL